MTTRRRGARTVGGILLALGVVGVIGAAVLAMAPGLGLPAAERFGSALTVDLPAGEHAVYVTPSDEWGSISCTGSTGEGEELRLRTSMTQQGLFVPERWDAQGSFAMQEAGTLVLSCDGPVAEGRFTVGPVVGLVGLVGPVLLAVLSIVVLTGGIVLLVVAANRRRPSNK